MQLDLLRAYLVVLEEGSVSRAAMRLHLGQPSLTRQIAVLEQEVGTRLLERSNRGVTATPAGAALAETLARPLSEIDAAILRCRRFGSGERAEIRIGYLQSLARSFLNPALAALRAAHPDTKVKLIDLCAGGQMRALREGELDVALIGQEGRMLARDFYTKRIRSVDVVAVLPDDHRLAKRRSLSLADLRGELFVGKDPVEAPGCNEWMAQLCRRAGFRPRFVRHADSVSQMFSLVVSEGAVALMPDFAAERFAPSVRVLPIEDAAAKWDLLVVWQRGRLAPPVKVLIDALSATPDLRLTALKSA